MSPPLSINVPKKKTIEAITKYAMTMCSRVHFSVYTSSTTQIMHIKTMIPSQARNISSPHGRADSASNRACTSTDNCARRAGDEETTSAAEASSSQNRAAADRHRGDNSQHQLHGCVPPRGRLSAATSKSW